MSRCFQYPPPGYSPNKASNYDLIESIKRDKERVKLERKKEKKREKKERRNRKKKEKAEQESSSRYGNLISGGDSRELKTIKIGDEIVERLENSSLSEEHGQPVCSQDPSYSSNSTQNNNKRKRTTSLSNGIHGVGSVVRIRLSSDKHGQCDISNKEDSFKETAKHEAERASKTNKQLFPFTSVSGQHSLSSGWTEPPPIAEDKTTTASCSKLHENDIEQEFKNLTNCVLPSFHYEFDDQDWLFQRKHKQMRVKEQGEVISNDMSCGTSALLPRAQYLDDAELYAFPFTVPF